MPLLLMPIKAESKSIAHRVGSYNERVRAS